MCTGLKITSHGFKSHRSDIFSPQDEISKEVKNHQEEVQLFHDAYDGLVAEDKVGQVVKYWSFRLGAHCKYIINWTSP